MPDSLSVCLSAHVGCVHKRIEKVTVYMWFSNLSDPDFLKVLMSLRPMQPVG